MKNINLIFLLMIITVALNSCKDYVENIDPLINAVDDSELNNESQIPFLIKGVETRFAYALSQTDVCAAGLSDAFIFDDNVPNATYPSFAEIDAGVIQLDNNSVDAAYNSVGQFRFYADDLIRRTNSISISDSTKKNEALFTGYFYGGYARFLYAAYFGLNPLQGGSPINNGPFIGSDEMYNLAIERFKKSLNYAANDLTVRTVNSVIARAYLYKGDYTDAALYAVNGLINGDDPFQALHNADQDNFWWEQAGAFRSQFVAAFRFKDYVDSDPAEADRIKLDSIMGINNVVYYYQIVYSEDSSPQNIITWQENNLMRAELNLRGAG
ncbi:MAG TPA: hypothetical protein VLB50_00675, partial [Ignavibacteriaceae bacterium]|nr:hypothetical protein [Ignavibacteriaceae bacterium]